MIKRDLLLFGKFTLFEKGFAFDDERLGIFMVPYEFVHKLTFHLDSDWLAVVVNKLEGSNLLPAQLIAEESFFIKIPSLDKLYH